MPEKFFGKFFCLEFAYQRGNVFSESKELIRSDSYNLGFWMVGSGLFSIITLVFFFRSSLL